MPKISSDLAFPGLPRLKQKSNDHCGPAVLSMLCDFKGIRLTQHKIVVAARVQAKLKKQGMTVYDMAKAVCAKTRKLVVWHKQNATLKDIGQLVNKYKTPVGIEWQGDFGRFTDEDSGHYSIITHVDTKNKILFLADPFEKYAGHDRQFSFNEFMKRWWDENEIIDKSGNKKIIRDARLLFIVTDNLRRFPLKAGMVLTPSEYAR